VAVLAVAALPTGATSSGAGAGDDVPTRASGEPRPLRRLYTAAAPLGSGGHGLGQRRPRAGPAAPPTPPPPPPLAWPCLSTARRPEPLGRRAKTGRGVEAESTGGGCEAP